MNSIYKIENILFRNRVKQITRRVLFYIFLGFILSIIVFPFYWLVVTSLKHEGQTQTYPPVFFPRKLIATHYIHVFTKEGIGKNLFNSMTTALSSTSLAVLIGSLAAYAISKTYLSESIRKAFLVAILLIRIFPPVVTTMPYFLIMSRIGLYDTLISLVITYVAFSLPFVIWLMLGFFQELPGDIEKAAIVDGCNVWQRFYRITLPLTLPGLATTLAFCFIYAWSEFLYAATLTSKNAKTLPIVVGSFISDKFAQWGPMSAAGVLMVIPVLVFSSFVQKYLVRGLTFGAIKG